MRHLLPLLIIFLLPVGCEKSSSSGSSSTTAGATGNAPASGPNRGAFTLLAANPADGAQDVPHDVILRLDFSAPLDAASVTSSSVKLEVVGRAVAVTLRVLGDRLEVEPQVVLAPGQAYTLTVQNLADATGNLLAGPLTIAFSSDPANGSRGLVFHAGVAVVDITPPIGVPLGGFGEGARRMGFPDLDPTNFHTFFAPSTGILDPILCKAIVLDDGVDRVALVSLDLIASDNRASEAIALKLQQRGVAIDFDHVMTCASHTHSGPGGITEQHFWELAAMDLYLPGVFDDLTSGIADAIEQAVLNLAPATIAIGSGQLTGVAVNRRAPTSPYLDPDDIDPELGVIRIEHVGGAPLATLYNYAVHGLAYWSDNMEYSADLMGDASAKIEAALGGVALFINGAEGDINPDRGVASSDAQIADLLGSAIAAEVQAIHAGLVPAHDVDLASAWNQVDMGDPNMFLGVNAGGLPPLIANFTGPLPSWGVTIPLSSLDIDRSFRYQAIRLQNTLLSSIPGEAIHEIGLEVKAMGALLGFEHTFVCGLANGHMAYITNQREYNVGGYEALASLFGDTTGQKVVDACALTALQVAP